MDSISVYEWRHASKPAAMIVRFNVHTRQLFLSVIGRGDFVPAPMLMDEIFFAAVAEYMAGDQIEAKTTFAVNEGAYNAQLFGNPQKNEAYFAVGPDAKLNPMCFVETTRQQMYLLGSLHTLVADPQVSAYVANTFAQLHETVHGFTSGADNLLLLTNPFDTGDGLRFSYIKDNVLRNLFVAYVEGKWSILGPCPQTLFDPKVLPGLHTPIGSILEAFIRRSLA